MSDNSRLNEVTSAVNVRVKLTTRLLVERIAQRENLTIREVVENAILQTWKPSAEDKEWMAGTLGTITGLPTTPTGSVAA